MRKGACSFAGEDGGRVVVVGWMTVTGVITEDASVVTEMTGAIGMGSETGAMTSTRVGVASEAGSGGGLGLAMGRGGGVALDSVLTGSGGGVAAGLFSTIGAGSLEAISDGVCLTSATGSRGVDSGVLASIWGEFPDPDEEEEVVSVDAATDSVVVT